MINVNVWQKPVQYCKVISLQLIKINEKEKKRKENQFSSKHKIKELGQRVYYQPRLPSQNTVD